VSNWKNAKGYTIPLDKRLAADGRGHSQVVISDKHAQVAESLLIAQEVCLCERRDWEMEIDWEMESDWERERMYLSVVARERAESHKEFECDTR